MKFAYSALLCLGVAHAQTPPCFALNDTTTTVAGGITAFGFAGPDSHAWQFTPASSNVVLGMRIFTNLAAPISGTTYFSSLEIWSDAGGLPGTRMGAGAWRLFQHPTNGWQGANLDHVVVMNAGTPYWLVWVEPGGLQVPTEPGGPNVLPGARRTGSGAWSASVSEAPKLRLYCSNLDDVYTLSVGPACSGSTGAAGTCHTNEQPQIGNAAFNVEGTGFLPNTLTILIVGVVGGFPTFPLAGLPPGCNQSTDVIGSVSGFTGTGGARGPTYAGNVLYPFGLPNNPALLFLYLNTQIAGLDLATGAALPFTTSNALQMTLF